MVITGSRTSCATCTGESSNATPASAGVSVFGVEQKNNTLVRRYLGYDRLDSAAQTRAVNDNLYRHCKQEKITFTRSRPYKKNDQAHVEQKNWSVVRRLIGYERYESDEALTLMRAIYQDWRLYVNFFQPVLKLVEKRRVGSKVRKRYDTARTPYQRVLESPDVSVKDKERLRQIYFHAQPSCPTPARRIDENLEEL